MLTEQKGSKMVNKPLDMSQHLQDGQDLAGKNQSHGLRQLLSGRKSEVVVVRPKLENKSQTMSETETPTSPCGSEVEQRCLIQIVVTITITIFSQSG